MVKGGTTTVKPRKNSPVRIEQDENLDIIQEIEQIEFGSHPVLIADCRIVNSATFDPRTPPSYWNEDGTEKAPQPLDGSGVRLQRDEGGTRATLMFGGFANKAEVQERKKQLISLLEGDTEYVMVDGAKTTLSQYNDPFTPPWKRLNEVSVPVVKK